MRSLVGTSAILGILSLCHCKTYEPAPDGKGVIMERNYQCDANEEVQTSIICPNLTGQDAIDAANEFEEKFIKSKGGNNCMRSMIEKCIALLRKQAFQEQK